MKNRHSNRSVEQRPEFGILKQEQSLLKAETVWRFSYTDRCSAMRKEKIFSSPGRNSDKQPTLAIRTEA
jgi:hypothetical protein